MKKTFQLLFATVALWCVAAWPATADPISITSGMISLPRPFFGGPMTLAGTDGVRSFTFDGVLSGGEASIAAFACTPCLPNAQISVAIVAFSAIFGTVVYGNETYLTNGAFSERKGGISLEIAGTGLLPPPPTAVGETATFMVPFTAAGRLMPPFDPPGGLGNSILGSGLVAITVLGGDPGNGGPSIWSFQSAQYRFGEQAPIPEPTSVLLLTTGLAGLALKRRSGGRSISKETP